MNTRYIRRVKTEKDESFAADFLMRRGFRQERPGVYRKGRGFLGPPSFISVEIENGKATVTAWKKHAIVPGVFAIDVRRRGRRIERLADSLAGFLSGETQEEEKRRFSGAAAFLSVLFGVASLFMWIVPAAGIPVSLAGLAVSANAEHKRRILLCRCFSVFGVSASAALVLLRLIRIR